MNAFHPDYMKTFYPNFWSNAAGQARKSQIMTDIRKTNPSHGTISGFSKNRVSLKPLAFLIYSRA